MMSFIKGIRTMMVSLKIYYKIKFVYPKTNHFEKIKSIIPKNINVEENVVIDENVELGSYLNLLSKGLYIGKNTYIGYCNKIGKFTSISFDVKIGLVAHPLNYLSTSPVLYSKRRGWVKENIYNDAQSGFVEIGNDVLISANAVILAGIKIGDGAVIGAGAVVNKDVPPYAVVAGVPAKIIRYRFSEEIIIKLLKIKWWDLSKDDILKFQSNFNNVQDFVNQYEL